MVNFICDACGQTIKKQKVEKHYQTECRNCSVLSCIDCGKEFPGDSYVSHISCISEAEKYQGKLYKAKEKANKGERKQQEWLEQVRNASSDSFNQDPRVRKLMVKITSYNNVPRKEKKFKKFCENSINIRDQALLETLWQCFSEARNADLSKDKNSGGPKSKIDNPAVNGETTCSNDNDVSEKFEDKTAKETTELMNKKEGKLFESCKRKHKESKKERKKRIKMEAQISEQVNKTENGEICVKKNKKEQKMEEQKDSCEVEVDAKNKKKRKYDEIIKTNGINESKTERDEKEQNGESKKKQKKIKHSESINLCTSINDCEQPENEVGNNEVIVQTEKFSWEVVIKKLLKSAPDNEMAVKKLRKKVINEYVTNGGDSRSRTVQELQALFEKKLCKNPKVKIHKEKAKYCR